MTRLADQILASVGREIDRKMFGAVSSLASDLAKAECFELTRDVAIAVNNVRTLKPSSLMSAIKFSRPPFPFTWVEWVSADIKQTITYVRDTASVEKPEPDRIGVLLQDIGVDGVFAGTWVWSHKDYGINICPISAVMAWEDGAIRRFADTAREALTAVRPIGYSSNETVSHLDVIGVPLSQADALKVAGSFSAWKPYVSDKSEISAISQMAEWETLGTSAHCVNFLMKFSNMLSADQRAAMSRSWLDDITGEPAFVRAFLILLNTKNGVVSTKEDLGRLNMARARHGKHNLREFQVTRLALANHAARLTTSGRSRDQARQHYVRGHFKVRSTGVFWWSPYVRGNVETATPRDRYSVRAGRTA